MSAEELVEQIIPRVPVVQAQFNLPTISVPLVGCFSGDGKVYVGKKWGNRSDLLLLNHVKQFKKDLTDKIITMFIGSKDNPTRALEFAVEMGRLAQEIDEALDAFEEVVGQITEEINAAIDIANSMMGELNSLVAAIVLTPAQARSKVQELMLNRYHKYFDKLEAQVSRLETTRNCLSIF
jgi:hypothetical protein